MGTIFFSGFVIATGKTSGFTNNHVFEKICIIIIIIIIIIIDEYVTLAITLNSQFIVLLYTQI